jgi:hypothetical protein
MKLGWTVVLLMLIAGCGSINEASGSLGTKPTPSLGAKPAVKQELPWLTVPGGRMRTTFFLRPLAVSPGVQTARSREVVSWPFACVTEYPSRGSEIKSSQGTHNLKTCQRRGKI